MLILAGVSLNAIIGDNGIITNAQQANLKNGMAILDEYMQELYVTNYDSITDEEAKVFLLQKLYPEYFYIPSQEGIGGLSYVVDSNGKALFLIKKSGLPKEIRSALVGGDAGNGTYIDYQSLNDVYGVTSDLVVYYSEPNGSNLYGITYNELDNDNPLRNVFTANGDKADMYTLTLEYDVNNDGKITAEEVKSIKEFTLTSSDNIKNLSELYNMTSLTDLTIDGKELDSLAGIQNCAKLSYLYIKNSTIKDYSNITGISKSLTQLYMRNTTDDQLNKICTSMSQTDFTSLKYILLMGDPYSTSWSFTEAGSYRWEWLAQPVTYRGKCNKDLTTIEPLSRLTKATKENVQFFGIPFNSVTDTDDVKQLNYIKDYINLIAVRIEFNKLRSLDGMEKMSKLSYLHAFGNNLGDDDTEESANSLKAIENTETNKHVLFMVDLSLNYNLKYVNYLNSNSTIRYLFLEDCDKTMSANTIADILAVVSTYVIPCKYLNGDKYLVSTYYDPATVTYDEIYSDLYENATIKKLNLSNVALLTNTELNTILKSMPQLTNVTLRGTNLSTLDFLSQDYCHSLIELDIQDTLVTDVTPFKNNDNAFNKIGMASSATNLNEIQDVIENLTGKTCSFLTDSGAIQFSTHEGMKLLETCTDLTKLTVRGPGERNPSTEVTVDLSNLKKLKTFRLYLTAMLVKVPVGLENVTFHYSWPGVFATPLESEELNLTSLNVNTVSWISRITSDHWENLIASIKGAKHIGTLVFQMTYKFDGTMFEEWNMSNVDLFRYCGHRTGNYYTDLKTLEGFENLTGLKHLELKTLPISDMSCLASLTQLEKLVLYQVKQSNCSYVSNLTNLVYLNMSDNEIIDISGLSNLVNLKYLNLENNNISALKPLENKIHLGEQYVGTTSGSLIYGGLNLKNNTIYDTSIDCSGTIYNNLKILGDLNPSAGKGGHLQQLYLSGNSNIIDFSNVSQYQWPQGKSGF